ncbi:MAG: ParA family protein [Rhodospirillaceae bacterium]
MKSIAIFNNKGGVGKTTLTFHLAHALGEMGKKVLIIDLDPQCNFSIYALENEAIEQIWEKEEPYIDGFKRSRDYSTSKIFDELVSEHRSVHFLLKPVEEGIDDLGELPPPVNLTSNIHFLPGRISLHMFEDKLSSRWSDVFVGDDLAIRTITSIKALSHKYAKKYAIDVVIFDTSPSLGILNRTILSMADGFLIPCNPDLFSLYGIKNIGRSLNAWSSNFKILQQVLPESRRGLFSDVPVKFLGYTIYKAQRYAGQNEWDLATGHFNYAQKIPSMIGDNIGKDIRAPINEDILNMPIGETAVMHTHQTMATMSQKYKVPMWEVPNKALDLEDKSTISGNRKRYYDTKERYIEFAEDLCARMEAI